MIASFTRGPYPASRGEKRIDSDAQLDQPFDRQPRAYAEGREERSLSRMDQSERAVRLNHNQMILTGEPLAVLDLHQFSGPRMKRIEDSHLERRTPGIVTLSRQAPAKAILLSRLPGPASAAAPEGASTTSLISSTGWKAKPAPAARDGWPISCPASTS